MNAITYADLFRPTAQAQSRLFDIAVIIGGSLLIALAAQCQFHLLFTPVPITGQTFAVLFLGMTLGSKRGAAAAATYIAEGCFGMPVFSGGAAGIIHLFGPTGGYLVGFIAAAFLTGFLAEHGWDRKPLTAALAMLAGEATIYMFGLPRLAFFVDHVFVLGLYPFLPAACLKIGLAMVLLPGAWKLAGKKQ